MLEVARCSRPELLDLKMADLLMLVWGEEDQGVPRAVDPRRPRWAGWQWAVQPAPVRRLQGGDGRRKAGVSAEGGGHRQLRWRISGRGVRWGLWPRPFFCCAIRIKSP